MPSKPNIEYKTLEIPAGLVSIANELAKISLDNQKPSDSSLYTYQDIFKLFIKRFGDYISYELLGDNNDEISCISIAGFTFYCDGDVDFDLKRILKTHWFHIFNIDFYGSISTRQLLKFYEVLKAHIKDLEETYKWIKYKTYVAPNKRG